MLTTINPRHLDGTTAEFVGDVLEEIDATYRSRDAIKAAAGVVAAIQRRDTQHLGGVPADQVHLTDEQWADLEKAARMTQSCHRAER